MCAQSEVVELASSYKKSSSAIWQKQDLQETKGLMQSPERYPVSDVMFKKSATRKSAAAVRQHCRLHRVSLTRVMYLVNGVQHADPRSHLGFDQS